MGTCCSLEGPTPLPWPRNGVLTRDYYTNNDWRMVVLGAGAVGKSTLTYRMVIDEYRREIDPTIEDSYTCTVNIRGKKETLDILDTVQSDYNGLLQHHWVRECDNFLLVYSVQSQRSFKLIQDMFKKILRNKEDQPFNVVLIGNKCDLYNECDKIQIGMQLTRENIIDLVYGYIRDGEKEFLNVSIIPKELKAICLKYHGEFLSENIAVTYEMGANLAESWQREYFKVPFFETSAKTGENVEKAFKRVVMLALDGQGIDYSQTDVLA